MRGIKRFTIRRCTFNFLMLIMLVIFLDAKAQKDPDGLSKNILALDTAVRYGKLDNGFTYYLRRNDSPAKTIELHMIMKAGEYHEDEDQWEYAHLLEHVGANGTKHFPRVKDFFRTSGRYSNAQTGKDHTVYYAVIPSGDKEVLHSGLQVLRDWAQDIRLNTATIDVQRGAVLGEMRTNDPYRHWVRTTIKKKILANTGFRFRNPVKAKANIENFNREALLRYYKDWYRPDLQAAIIVGDIDLDSVEMQVKRLFSDLKMPNNPRDPQKPLEAQMVALSGNNQFITVLDTVRPEFRLKVIFKRKNQEYNIKTRADIRAMLLQQLYKTIIGIRSKHLEQQYDPPFANFSINYTPNTLAGRQITATSLTVGLEPEDPKQMKKSFGKAMLAWKRMHTGITGTEVRKVKEQIRLDYSNQGSRKSKQLAKRYRDHFVRGTAAPDPEWEKRMILEVLKEIDLQEIQEFVNNYANFKVNTDFLFFKGKEGAIPNYDKFKKWLAEVDARKVVPFEPPQPPITSLADIARLPVGKVEETKELSENTIGVSTVLLPNNIKLVLKPTQPRSASFAQTISIEGFRPNNVPTANRIDYLAALVAPELLKFTGVGTYNKFELDRFMQEKGFQLKFKTNKDSQEIHADGRIEAIDELLNLLYLYVDQPRRDSLGFASWKAYQKKQLKGEGLRGSSDFIMENLHGLWYPQIPRLNLEDLEQLSMEKVFQAADQWFSDFKDFTFIVTGDFDKDQIGQKLIRKLSAFPVRVQPSGAVATASFPLHKMDERIKEKKINQAYVRLYFPVTASKNIKTQIELKLLSKALNQRIYNRLRNGCFAPTAQGEWVDRAKGIYAFKIRFDSELGNENKMIRYALEEFGKLKQKGVDQKWLEKALADEKAAYGARLGSFGYFNFWPEYLYTKLRNGEDLVTEVLQYEALLDHFISLKDINTAAKKYLTEENMQQFVVLPERYQLVN